MATVTGLTAERMQEIVDSTVSGAHISGNDLILELTGGGEVNAGNVRGPIGPIGSADIGDVKSSIRSSIPGWYLMGTSVPNADVACAELWAFAPADWKSGTTLNIPPMDDRIIQGGGVVGSVTGSNTTVIDALNLPPHVHTMPNHQHSIPNHTHTMAHVHSHSHTHPGSSLDVAVIVSTSIRNSSTPGTTASPMAASASGATELQTSNPTATASVSGSTGAANPVNTGGSSAPNTGSAGAGSTGNAGAGDTGGGPGASTPLDIQQSALRLNFFIYAGNA